MSGISKAAFGALAKKVRDSPNTLKNLIFADATTSKTILKTQDIRLDVRKITQIPP